MNHWSKIKGIIFLFVIVIHIYPAIGFAKEKVNQAQLDKLKQQIVKFTKQIQHTDKKQNAISKKIRVYDEEVATVGAELKALSVNKLKLQKKVDNLKTQLQSLNNDIAKIQNSLNDITVVIFKLGDFNYIKALVNQDNPAEHIRFQKYYSRLKQTFEINQAQLSKNIDKQKVVKASLESKIGELDELLKLKDTALEKLSEKRKNKKAYFKFLENQSMKKKRKLASLKSDQKNLEKLLKKMRKLEMLKKASGMSFAKNTKSLKWPINGKILQKFGSIRKGSGLRSNGIVIESKLGADVRSVARGRVVFSDWLSGYGYVMILDHENGYMSLYGHNQRLLKNVGEVAKVQEIIAEVGSSGRRNTPALYFEIRHRGKPVNPKKWLLANR